MRTDARPPWVPLKLVPLPSFPGGAEIQGYFTLSLKTSVPPLQQGPVFLCLPGSEWGSFALYRPFPVVGAGSPWYSQLSAQVPNLLAENQHGS